MTDPKHQTDDAYFNCLLAAAQHRLKNANAHHRAVINSSHSDAELEDAEFAVTEALAVLDFLQTHRPFEFR